MKSTISIKHLRQQWAVGHGFFHSAKIDVDGATYRYVYDCGSHHNKNLANKRVDELSNIEMLDNNKKPHIDMLVVSHFHADHINGIPHLFQKFRIKKLVLPFLAQNSQIVALAQLAAAGPAAWKELHEIVTDPQSWVHGNNGEETQITQISDENGETLEGHTPTENYDGLSIGSSGILNHKSAPSIYKSGKIIWSFLFYTQNNSDVSAIVINNLKGKFNLPDESALLDKLKDEIWIKESWNTIEDCFKKLGSNNQNATSLCLFSGPACDYRLYDVRTPSFPWFYFRRYWPWREAIGWLGTGDAQLKNNTKYQTFEQHYNKILRKYRQFPFHTMAPLTTTIRG